MEERFAPHAATREGAGVCAYPLVRRHSCAPSSRAVRLLTKPVYDSDGRTSYTNVLYICITLNMNTAATLPPGPRLPYWLQTMLIWGRTEDFQKWHRRRSGSTLRVRASPSKVSVYVTERADLKRVFAADPDV